MSDSTVTSPKSREEIEISDVHDLNGLKVVQNPARYLVNTSDETTENGLVKGSIAPDKLVPSPNVAYISTDQEGYVKTEEHLEMELAGNHVVLLEGEAGTGKNTLIDTICAEANLSVYRENFGLDTSVYEVVAQKEVVEGDTIAILGELAKAAVFGGVFVADEVNMVEGDVSSHLHAITEEKGKRELTITGTGRTLTDLPEDEEWNPEEHLGEYIHPAFRFVGTANPITYAGTGEGMNDAFRDRFSITLVDYPENETEAAILHQSVEGSTMDQAKKVMRLAEDLRSMDQSLMCPISPRQLKNVLRYAVQHDTSLENGAKAKLVPYPRMENDRQAIKDSVEDVLG